MQRGSTVIVFLAFFLLAASVAQARDEVAFSLGPFDLLGESRSLLEVGAGRFDIGDGDSTEAVKVEGRLGRKLSFVGPALGGVANRDGGVFGYVGAYIDIAVGRFTFTPLGGFGLYRRGDSKDLGGPFIFRSSISIVYRLSERFGIGASLGHVSNGKLYSRNPGQDDFMVSLIWRF
jgi:lipid A 3-O-deacylase